MTVNSWGAVVCGALLWASAQAVAQAPLQAVDAGSSSDPQVIAAQIDSAVQRLVKKAQDDARELLVAKNYASALKTLEGARELAPSNVATIVALSELQVLLGHAERAEALYRDLIRLDPERGSAYVALGDLLAADTRAPVRLKEAADCYVRARDLLGQDAALLLRQARLSATRGLHDDAERSYQAYLASHGPDDALRIELGDFYRDAGKPDDAAQWYRQVSGAGSTRVAAQRIFELEVDREARRYGLGQHDSAKDAQARALATRARVQSGQGQLAQAEALLHEALRLSPGLASLHADLADLLHSAKRDDEAELEYLRAIALDGTQPDVPLRLAQLYLQAKSEHAIEAGLLAQRSLQLRPDWTEPQLLLARAYQAQGDLPRALLRVKRFLGQAEAGADRDQALALQASLELLLGSAGKPIPTATDGAAIDPLARVRAFIARGRSDAALAQLQRMKGAAQSIEALNLQAQLLDATGRLEEAARVLERSLARNDQQPDSHEALARILLTLRQPSAARPHLLACEHAGNLSCRFRLAQLDAASTDGAASLWHDLTHAFELLHARERLADLHADRKSRLSEPEIARLRDDVHQRLLVLLLIALGALVLLSSAIFFVQRFRWGGVDLATLLERHPQTGPDVQRILSAIQHEVLKHNTLMLAGFSETLQSAAPSRQTAEHVLRAFFGADGRGGAQLRLQTYVEQLIQLARGHGERLNAQRRDPLLTTLLSGLRRMRKLSGQLLAAESLSPAGQTRLARKLQQADRELNQRGHAELRVLLDRVRLLRVDAALLLAIFDRVRHEPALAAAPIGELRLDTQSALPCAVLLPAAAFEDILANLLRNALQASLRQPNVRPVIVGIRVDVATDPITAVESVCIRVRDRAPETLNHERLRGAYIEAGLGLTADLVARYEGQLDISDSEPDSFLKAVVLHLPGNADPSGETR